MTRLSVNVNKLATLRNSRGKNLPDVLAWSEKILKLGVFGITVHPRPDSRHIRHQDVVDLAQLLKKYPDREFNVEGYPSEDFLKLIQLVRPHQATLVPDPPEALTSNAGWRLAENLSFLKEVITRIQSWKVRVSLFVDPDHFTPADQAALKRLGCERVELYTEAYADHFQTAKQSDTLERYVAVARAAQGQGCGINAGHDLNQKNLGTLVKHIPQLAEVSIGHALICEALEEGMSRTIANYLKILNER